MKYLKISFLCILTILLCSACKENDNKQISNKDIQIEGKKDLSKYTVDYLTDNFLNDITLENNTTTLTFYKINENKLKVWKDIISGNNTKEVVIADINLNIPKDFTFNNYRITNDNKYIYYNYSNNKIYRIKRVDLHNNEETEYCYSMDIDDKISTTQLLAATKDEISLVYSVVDENNKSTYYRILIDVDNNQIKSKDTFIIPPTSYGSFWYDEESIVYLKNDCTTLVDVDINTLEEKSQYPVKPNTSRFFKYNNEIYYSYLNGIYKANITNEDECIYEFDTSVNCIGCVAINSNQIAANCIVLDDCGFQDKSFIQEVELSN